MKTLSTNGKATQFLQIVSYVICIGLCARAVIGNDNPKEDIQKCVTAQKFVLVDENGKQRGVWEAGGNSVSLAFLDVDGKNWVNISAVMEKDGIAHIAVGPGDDEKPFVNITSIGSVASVGVFTPKNSESTRNYPKASMSVRKGVPIVELKNFPKKSRVTLSLGDKEPKLEMRDENDKVSWATP